MRKEMTYKIIAGNRIFEAEIKDDAEFLQRVLLAFGIEYVRIENKDVQYQD